MAQARTQGLLELIRDTHTHMLDYLRCADERQERQNRAMLSALTEIQRGQESLAKLVLQQGEMLRDMHAMTARVMEQSNQILLQLGGSGATH
jgi:hypothetical protein